jgi:hypothetical protein
MDPKQISIKSTFVLYVMTSAAIAADQPKSDAPNTVTGAGCISKGVEAGCLILKDLDRKTEYNVLFKGKKPKIDTAISFQGQVHSGLTTCMQGTAVAVTRWHQITLRCPQEEASPKK